MISEDLKQTIEKNFGEILKMDRIEKSRVFLELHKELVFIMNREFNIQDPTIEISEVNFIAKNATDGETKK